MRVCRVKGLLKVNVRTAVAQMDQSYISQDSEKVLLKSLKGKGKGEGV